MPDIKEILTTKQSIYAAADDMLFARAFSLLKTLLQHMPEWWAVEECDVLEKQCVQMLRFNMGDVRDEGRTAFMGTLRDSLYSLTDRVVERAMQLYAPGYDYEQLRVMTKRGEADGGQIERLLLDSEAQEVYDEPTASAFSAIFRHVWLKESMTAADDARWRSYLTADGIAVTARMMIASALTVRMLRMYDARILRIMIELSPVVDARVKARLYVGVVLLLNVYSDRIIRDSALMSLLKSLWSGHDAADDLNKAYACLLRTFKTDEIVRRMNEEIYPEMLKTGTKLREMMKRNQSDGNTPDEEGNPSWMFGFENEEMADKLRLFSDMQLSGDDVYMSSFATMKHFPFFDEFSHWFMPFDVRLSDVNGIVERGGDMMKFLAGTGQMCHSDKYSFFFIVAQIPSGNMKDMVAQYGGADVEQMREEMSSEKWKEKQASARFDMEVRAYSQDLFRFYRLYRRKSDFVNPFTFLPRVADSAILRTCMSVADLRRLCRHLLDAGQWSESSLLFEYLDSQDVWDAAFYQQMGFCAEKLGRHADALSAYEKADLVHPDDIWTARRRAVCFRKTGNLDAAVECYERILLLSPDDVTVIIHLANCYIQHKVYDRARSLYYKADYLSPDDSKVRRLLAWCLFLETRYDEALAVYSRLLERADALPDDALNAGHTLLALHRRADAYDLYRRCLRMTTPDRFTDLMRADLDDLLPLGYTTEDVTILINQLLML